jgi:hypothetical protein
MTERLFTVEEANALLPQLRRSLEAIRQARHEVLAGAEPFRGRARTNGGGEQAPEYWEAMSTLRKELEALIGLGIVLRDAESGLIDFPSRIDDREVFLCWRPDEDRVGYWHGPESGFAGRRPL